MMYGLPLPNDVRFVMESEEVCVEWGPNVSPLKMVQHLCFNWPMIVVCGSGSRI